VVSAPRAGERLVIAYDHFNVEAEPFPYPDASFDLALFCEIIEHLPNDPVHALAEIHRVLRQPEGRLVLTTPNAVRLESLLRISRGQNVYEPLSGHGTYGRHNREYTAEELRGLLGACGYEVERLLCVDLRPPPVGFGRLPRDADPGNRGANLLAVARPEGAPRRAYPAWLFASRHGVGREAAAGDPTARRRL
jgi:SAM-dependent methyltransferase